MRGIRAMYDFRASRCQGVKPERFQYLLSFRGLQGRDCGVSRNKETPFHARTTASPASRRLTQYRATHEALQASRICTTDQHRGRIPRTPHQLSSRPQALSEYGFLPLTSRCYRRRAVVLLATGPSDFSGTYDHRSCTIQKDVLRRSSVCIAPLVSPGRKLQVAPASRVGALVSKNHATAASANAAECAQ